MSARSSIIPELEDAFTRGTGEQRERALTQITSLFVNSASQFSDEHIQLFDDVFGLLIDEIETKARAHLATRLAPIPNAPIHALQRLAHDSDISVAGPVLRGSRRLGEPDLLAVARNMSQDHLLALSARKDIGPTITDVLIDRGNRQVTHAVAENAAAHFSDRGFTTLVRRAEGDARLAETVALRGDVPPRLFRTLLAQASEVVQKRLLAKARPETAAEIRRVLMEVTAEIGDRAQPRDYTAALKTVTAMRQAGQLGHAALMEFAKAGQFEESVVALSMLCKIPLETADRLLTGDRPDPALILCRAIGIGWAGARALLTARPSLAPMTTKMLDEAFGNFEKLSPETASRVVRFWQARPNDSVEN
ncbi:MAG TPA: DUF2336 domain-containing protein [Xanthobacteraceae bacterium]|jgi:uncharacterized protein (DUF2336 family)|nr:DUF2336 domain-containing protein [Xanthobacteraceae bacterium]